MKDMEDAMAVGDENLVYAIQVLYLSVCVCLSLVESMEIISKTSVDQISLSLALSLSLLLESMEIISKT